VIRQTRGADSVRVTFTLDTDTAVSVVGDFNGWDPAAHRLKPRSNGKRSVSVLMDPGREVSFRYLAEGGHFFDDADADRYDDNGYGGTHSVLVLRTAKAANGKPAANGQHGANGKVTPAAKAPPRKRAR
jgi:hypothetical protein